MACIIFLLNGFGLMSHNTDKGSDIKWDKSFIMYLKWII